MNKLTKLSTVIFVSGIILAGCGSNKELTEKKENKVLSYTTVKDIGDMNPMFMEVQCPQKYDL